MKKCDCCGKKLGDIWASVLYRDVFGTEFELCDNCAKHIELLKSKEMLSDEELQSEIAWGAAMLKNGTVNGNKRETFQKLVGVQMPDDSGKEIGFENGQNKSALHQNSNAGLNDYYTANDSGSIWTIVGKISCFLLVVGLMIVGGMIAHYSFESGGYVLLGGVIGLVVGLVIISSQMILLKMADDIADIKKYIRK